MFKPSHVRFSKKEIFIHIVVWSVAYFLFAYAIDTIGIIHRSNGSILVALSWGTVISLWLFYFNFLVLLKRYYFKQALSLYLMEVGLFLLITSFLETIIDFQFLVNYYSTEPETFIDQLILNVVLNGFIVGLSSFYWLIKNHIHIERQRNLLEQQKLSTEMAFLKSQINPHFLFNALNTMYSLSLRYRIPEITENITRISGMMRYMVYETGKDKISLENEIQFLEDYMTVSKSRTAEGELDITFNKTEATSTFRIAPMLLLPLVENAFKHGVAPHKKSKVFINLKAKDSLLLFEVTNEIVQPNPSSMNFSSGFGLNNLRTRLDHLYQGNYQLTTGDENGVYKAQLLIQV